MGFLLAAFGHVESADWQNLLGRPDDDWGESPRSDWQEAVGGIRLATQSPHGAPCSPVQEAGELVAGAVGRVGGQGRSAAPVLDAYRRAGTAGLAGLRGQYAYALWDRGARALFVGCDAMGLRAPAYTWDGRTFLLSTRAITLSRRSRPLAALDEIYLAHALSGVWARTASATAFRGIRRMVGGELIRVSARGLDRLGGERLTFSIPRADDRESVLRELGQALARAVGDEGRDGPCCVALSGGVDSCVVATVIAERERDLNAFSLVAPDGSPGDAMALAPVIAAFPGMRHHRVLLTGGAADPPEVAMIPDDPVCAGPVLQAGRVALLRNVRTAGFERMFDGEGGDEIFDIAWRPGDLIRQGAVGPLLSSLRCRAARRRILRDFIASGRGPAAGLLVGRMMRGVRERRPWLRPEFWNASAFASAWDEAVAFTRLRSARHRMPEIIGTHGRYWRTQELARIAAGVQGSSPFLDRRVVELVGSVHASVAMDLGHGKALLRQLAAQRVPAAIAWRPKNEPLNDWLIDRWISQDANVRRTIAQIKDSPLLSEHIDRSAVLVAVDQARRVGKPNWLSSAIVELNVVVEWVTAVQTRYGR